MAHHNSLGICCQLKIRHLYGTFHFLTQGICMGTGSLFVYRFSWEGMPSTKENGICSSVNCLQCGVCDYASINLYKIFIVLITFSMTQKKQHIYLYCANSCWLRKCLTSNRYQSLSLLFYWNYIVMLNCILKHLSLLWVKCHKCLKNICILSVCWNYINEFDSCEIQTQSILYITVLLLNMTLYKTSNVSVLLLKLLISSPELKAQVSYCCPFLSVVLKRFTFSSSSWKRMVGF